MPERTCKTCTEIFSLTHHAQLHCEGCRESRTWTARRKVPCSVCGESTGVSASARREGFDHRCNPCVKASRQHGTTTMYGRGKCRCDACQAAQTAAMRVYTAKRVAEGRPIEKNKGPRPTYVLVCTVCGESFTSKHRKQQFCSQTCNGQSKRTTTRELVHVGPKPHRRGVVETIDITPRRPRFWCSGPCGWCGEQFTLVDQVTARFCSAACSKAAGRRRRAFRFKPSKLVRRMIYERDGWVCQLCLEPVDESAHYLDDWAPSLDHIECQSWALIPDHSPENLRLCHRWCNMVRGDGSRHTDFFEGMADAC